MEQNRITIDTHALIWFVTVEGLEFHDRIIVATAILTNSTLVSKDRAIGNFGITVAW